MTDKEKLAIIKDLIADALDSKCDMDTSANVLFRHNQLLVALMEHIEDVIEDRPSDLNQKSAARN